MRAKKKAGPTQGSFIRVVMESIPSREMKQKNKQTPKARFSSVALQGEPNISIVQERNKELLITIDIDSLKV